MNNNRYKFRGKRVDNGEWIQGTCIDVYKDCDEHGAIVGYKYNIYYFDRMVEVSPSTFSQCTGFPDRNEKELYQGDIYMNQNGPKKSTLYVVAWHPKKPMLCGIRVKEYNNILPNVVDELSMDFKYKREKIGNKWDNPELLENQ